ncbi:MAG: hypothetical protein KFF73_19285 [Cyclobacteriaceae bacterium]|nr:hypothetical protein [Cyclobacteriaceae bacterium]
MTGRAFIIFILIGFCGGKLTAQILDDSTQNVYGPTTTRFTYLNDIKFNRNRIYFPDTTITRFHIYNYVNLHENKLQDLGNMGTAAQPVFYEPPETIGWTSGYHVYDPYRLRIEDMQLYNTRSPFTHIYAILGGGNRNKTYVQHSQSIRPNWNFGFNYQTLRVNKQVSSTGRGDNEVESTAYNAYMYYWTKDSAYFIHGAFSRINHKVDESGGIDDSNFNSKNEFFSENVNVNLENAGSRLLNIQYLLYQQYGLKDYFTLYNEFSRSLASNYFQDENLSADGAYFDQFLLNTAETDHLDEFKSLSNEAGIKGDWKKAFYNAYFLFRQTNYIPGNISRNATRNETYLGGSLRYDDDSTYYLRISGELMNNGNHQLSGIYENRLWELSYNRYMYEPAAIHEKYFSNHYEWYNDFGPVQSDNFKGLFKLDFNMLRLKPQLTISNIFNYIYFNADKRPAQAGGSAQLYSPGLEVNFDITPFLHWNITFIYTIKSGIAEATDAFRIPSIFVNSNLYYSRYLFDKKLLTSIGLETHFRDAYFADGYDPVTQQFYLQNDFQIPGYFTADFYANIKIGALKLFLKMTYVNQGQVGGYFASPYYIGQTRVFDLGISWMFYD